MSESDEVRSFIAVARGDGLTTEAILAHVRQEWPDVAVTLVVLEDTRDISKRNINPLNWRVSEMLVGDAPEEWERW